MIRPGGGGGGGGGLTHTSGTLAARPASPVAGDTYQITSGVATGDRYECFVSGAWTYVPGPRDLSPDLLDDYHWRLDESSSVYVSTGARTSIDLTVSGSPVSRTAVSYAGRGCFQVAAASARGAAGVGISTAPTALSMSAWVRPTAYSTYNTVLFCDYASAGADPYGATLDLGSGGFRLLLVKAATLQEHIISGALTLGVWHHTGFEYTGGVCTTYLDGYPIDEWTPTGGAALDLGTGSRWVVGDKPGVAAQTFTGSIASARIYAGARAASWWREVYARGTGAYLGS